MPNKPQRTVGSCSDGFKATGFSKNKSARAGTSANCFVDVAANSVISVSSVAKKHDRCDSGTTRTRVAMFHGRRAKTRMRRPRQQNLVLKSVRKSVWRQDQPFIRKRDRLVAIIARKVVP
jgi:hypothetical protein